MIAPYVWDSCIVTRDGEQCLKWRSRTAPEDDVFIIMEPNISFQKASLIPLLTIERWYRNGGKQWKGKVVVVNGERLQDTPHFSASVKPHLEIFKDGRVEMTARNDILTIMKTYPSAVFILHQYNNEYNYMTLELLSCGFPVIHNSDSWGAFGYTYKGNNIEESSKQLKCAHESHSEHLEVYKAHAQALIWKHSPYNPEVHFAWEELLKK